MKPKKERLKIGLLVSPDLHRALSALARQEGRPLANYVRRLCEAAVQDPKSQPAA